MTGASWRAGGAAWDVSEGPDGSVVWVERLQPAVLSAPLGGGPGWQVPLRTHPVALSVIPGTHTALVAGAFGGVAVVDLSTPGIAGEISVPGLLSDIATTSEKAVVASADRAVAIIDIARGTTERTVKLPAPATAVAALNDENTVVAGAGYAALLSGGDTCWLVSLDDGPHRIAVHGGAVWVTAHRRGDLLRMDLAGRITARVATGFGPWDVVGYGDAMIVGNYTGGTLAVVDVEAVALSHTIGLDSPWALATGADGLFVARAQLGDVVLVDPLQEYTT